MALVDLSFYRSTFVTKENTTKLWYFICAPERNEPQGELPGDSFVVYDGTEQRRGVNRILGRKLRERTYPE